MVDQGLSERLALAGVGGGDLVCAAGRAPPAHAVDQPGRRKADLGQLEALARLAQHLVGGNADIVQAHHRVAARHGAVDGVEDALDADPLHGQIDQEHGRALIGLGHDDADLGALGPGDEGLAAVDHPVIAVQPGGGLHHRRVRSGAALRRRFGHEEGRTRPALQQGLQEPRLLIGARDLAEQEHVALVGRGDIDRHRAQRRKPRRAQHHGHVLMAQMAAGRDVRRQHASGPRLVTQLGDEVVGGAMGSAPRIALVRDHGLADEGFDLGRDGASLLGRAIELGIGRTSGHGSAPAAVTALATH